MIDDKKPSHANLQIPIDSAAHRLWSICCLQCERNSNTHTHNGQQAGCPLSCLHIAGVAIAIVFFVVV